MENYTEYCPLCGAHPFEQGEQGGTPEDDRITKEQLNYWKDHILELAHRIEALDKHDIIKTEGAL